MTTNEHPGADSGGTGAESYQGRQTAPSIPSTPDTLDLNALADVELERLARHWSRVVTQARRDLPYCPPELDDVVYAAARVRLLLKRRKAARNLAAAHAEVQRFGGGQ